MAIVVWFTVGLAIWHFTIFVPERFWAGLIGALIGCLIGALVSGALIALVTGNNVNDTSLLTLIEAVPGTLIGAAVVYRIGQQSDAAEIEI